MLLKCRTQLGCLKTRYVQSNFLDWHEFVTSLAFFGRKISRSAADPGCEFQHRPGARSFQGAFRSPVCVRVRQKNDCHRDLIFLGSRHPPLKGRVAQMVGARLCEPQQLGVYENRGIFHAVRQDHVAATHRVALRQRSSI
jgi:hypothetical protein